MRPFLLERYFAQHEFTARAILSASDCESLSMAELLHLADRETAALWSELRLAYTESPGHPVLREEIARLYQGIAPSQVLVAAPEEAIFLAMHALAAPGDEIVVLTPAYQSLHEIAASIGVRVVRWPLTPRAGRWHLDLDLLPQLLTPRTRALVVNFPHNPTGLLPSFGEWERMLALVERAGVRLFSDEMYRFLEPDPALRLPAGCTVGSTGISLGGLSKSLSAPGVRIGWLATQDGEFLSRCQALKDYTTICSSAPSEILALIALRARETIVERNLGIIRENLAVAERYFGARTERFEWLPPMAGPVAFPRWTGRLPVDALADQVVRESGVMIVPGTLFEAPAGHFRVGLGRRTFPEALAAAGTVLDRLPL
ncbi:MAG: aminotransferase class I/II-fold pyridoxal phosphate-dependent enzyme [Gemmatimonadales bacterium]|nr:aminotransferase class I/II-fold pyridoxal phosphate-dependent enzyme [Gemmatimonadales bacterium]